MALNTEEFLQTTTQEALDDHLEPWPAGEWLAQITDIAVSDFEFKKGDRIGETGYRMIVKYEAQDAQVVEICERDKVSVSDSILLDVTPDGNGLDFGKGKNIGLGRLRTATGQNVPGQEWSPMMLKGQPVKVSIKHEIYEDRPVARVKDVAAP